MVWWEIPCGFSYLGAFRGSHSETLTFVKARRSQVAPADCFAEAVMRWLKLDDLATKGPRRATPHDEADEDS